MRNMDEMNEQIITKKDSQETGLTFGLGKAYAGQVGRGHDGENGAAEQM